MSMMGSGIYSVDVDVEIVCAEQCWECDEANEACDAIWTASVMTDDWGNIDQEVICPKCGHLINYRLERE